MVDLPALRLTDPARRAQRHLRGPQAQGLALALLLAPLAVLASYALAAASGASTPILAAGVTGVICALGGTLVLRGLSPDHYPHERLGYCNGVTMLRSSGIAVLAGLATAPGALNNSTALAWTVTVIAACVLALDGVDGWAARRSGLRSEFGARFDVETDVLFAIVMAILAWQAGKVGVWFLALGGLRPAFLLAGGAWPALRAPLPDVLWRKCMAAAQMILQVVLLAPIIVPPASTVLGAGILGALLLSFGVDIRALLRRAKASQRDTRNSAR